MKDKGITFIELMVVFSIIGILMAALGFSYQEWVGKYKVERTTKELYADLMHARVMAMQKNREHYAVLNGGEYSVVEDTNDDCTANSGDNTLQSFPKMVEYPMIWNNNGDKIYFDKRGLLTPNRTIWFTSTAGSDYDCIKISRTRIIMGRYDGAECDAK